MKVYPGKEGGGRRWRWNRHPHLQPLFFHFSWSRASRLSLIVSSWEFDVLLLFYYHYITHYSHMLLRLYIKILVILSLNWKRCIIHSLQPTHVTFHLTQPNLPQLHFLFYITHIYTVYVYHKALFHHSLYLASSFPKNQYHIFRPFPDFGAEMHTTTQLWDKLKRPQEWVFTVSVCQFVPVSHFPPSLLHHTCWNVL